MKCGEFKKIIYLYLKDELPKDIFNEGKKHLDECRKCKRMFDSLNHYISNTDKFLNNIDTNNHPDIYELTSLQLHSKKKYRLHIQAGIAAVAAAIFLTAISLFLFKPNETAPVKPSDGTQIHQTPKVFSESTTRDTNGSKIQQNNNIKVVANNNTITSPEDKEFRKRYNQWQKERKESAEPVMLVEIHHDFNIREIHFLNK